MPMWQIGTVLPAIVGTSPGIRVEILATGRVELGTSPPARPAGKIVYSFFERVFDHTATFLKIRRNH